MGISSAQRPFRDWNRDCCLALAIMRGMRETAYPNSPPNYVKLYEMCWHSEPVQRPSVDDVIYYSAPKIEIERLEEATNNMIKRIEKLEEMIKSLVSKSISNQLLDVVHPSFI
jgi:hypothetical protein